MTQLLSCLAVKSFLSFGYTCAVPHLEQANQLASESAVCRVVEKHSYNQRYTRHRPPSGPQKYTRQVCTGLAEQLLRKQHEILQRQTEIL